MNRDSAKGTNKLANNIKTLKSLTIMNAENLINVGVDGQEKNIVLQAQDFVFIYDLYFATSIEK